MKTTVEVPDDLYRQAKAEAALRGRKLKDLIQEGLRLVLETPRGTRRRPGLAELMKRAEGVIDSGVPDLASNPEHLKGFGRDAGNR
jgi:predicted component of type VI protein secretion system